MDKATIKQRKTSKQQTEIEIDDSDEEAAYESNDKQRGAVFIEDVDSNMLSNKIKTPSTFVIILLIAVLILLAYEFGNLQKQINILHKENSEQVKLEHKLKDQVKNLKKEVSGVMHEEVKLAHQESMLEIKEKRLENEVKEGHNGDHHLNHHGDFESIDMHPLMKHEPKQDLDLLGQGIKGLFENSLNVIKRISPNFQQSFNNLQKTKKRENEQKKHAHEAVQHAQEAVQHAHDVMSSMNHHHDQDHKNHKPEHHNEHKPAHNEHHQEAQKIPKSIKIE